MSEATPCMFACDLPKPKHPPRRKPQWLARHNGLTLKLDGSLWMGEHDASEWRWEDLMQYFISREEQRGFGGAEIEKFRTRTGGVYFRRVRKGESVFWDVTAD